MRKIMILGAGQAQLPLYRAARGMGAATVAVSIPGPYPALAEANEICSVDITDPAGVAAAAGAFGVGGVVSCCSEICLPALARACEEHGLAGITPQAAAISVNKRVMHEAFDRGGIPSPRWRAVSSEAELREAAKVLGYPLVVKAPDLFSSRGVYVTGSEEEALAALGDCLAETSEPYVLAEEFIAGRGCCLEGFVQKGEILFLLPDGNLAARIPGGPAVPVGHFAPLDEAEDVLARLRDTAAQAIRVCGFDNCAVNMDIVLRKGEPCIIELTARAGATGLPELISLHLGVDFYRMLVMVALGEDVRPLFDRRPEPRPAAVRMLFPEADGILRAVHYPQPLPPGVQSPVLFRAPGDAVRAFRNAGDRIGQFLVTGPTAAECVRRAEAFSRVVRVEVVP